MEVNIPLDTMVCNSFLLLFILLDFFYFWVGYSTFVVKLGNAKRNLWSGKITNKAFWMLTIQK